MAEACRFGDSVSNTKVLYSNNDHFCVFNVFCVFISLVTILADLTTEILVFAEYCKNGSIYWAATTLLFLLIPNVIINIFSLRWIVIDEKSKLRYWITHGLMIGFFERYSQFLYKIFSCKNLESMRSQKLLSQRNDLSLLHILYCFTGTVPQIILQSYAISTLTDNHETKAFSIAASGVSVIWACISYIYTITSFQNENFQWISVFFKVTWHFGMLISRISGILIFTIMFGLWTFVPLGLHWAAMTFWIVTQKTTFCPNKLEETFYNFVMGFVYCFCYINLREGQTRYRLIVFYTLMIIQNFGSLLLYILVIDFKKQSKLLSLTASTCIVAGTLIGICGMVLYYRWFHAKGPISWKNVQSDVELNNKVTKSNVQSKENGLSHVRSFKSQKDTKITNNERSQDSKENPQNITENADKKFLLDHWIARSGTPTFVSVPICNNSLEASSIEIHTVENTPIIKCEQNPIINKANMKIKKKGTSLTEELINKLQAIEFAESSIDEITSKNNSNSHRRRGICSSHEFKYNDDSFDLPVEIGNNTEMECDKVKSSQFSDLSCGKKSSSDSIDLDLDLSLSDINSLDINTFNENIVQKLCLSALKNIKFGNQEADIENIQKIALDILKEMYTKKGKNITTDEQILHSKQRDIDTPTELLSVHDYENICAVNIAREAWGLRSWNGYFDIENWLHDGSVFSDRRRDTFTSGSSEISSCISQELKNYILSATPFPKKPPTYCNILVKHEKTNHDDYVNMYNSHTEETFSARPCMIDIKDCSQLEPIMEELDDLGDKSNYQSKKVLNSDSSLVATIDEIRQATVTNSPRNLYHRREHLWDSPQLTEKTKMESNLKKALWKEPSKFDSINIMKSVTEKENNVNNNQNDKLSTLDSSLNETEPCSSHNFRRKIKPINIKSNNKETQSSNFQDLSNQDIDLLWKIVSENTTPRHSTEDVSNQMTSSMQSLIVKDSAIKHTPVSKYPNLKKDKNKPRRKFSILREKFEPKVNRISGLDNVNQKPLNGIECLASNVMQVKNHLDITEKTQHVDECSKDKRINLTKCHKPVITKDTKEKRSTCVKQVLSPPTFNTKLRHKI